MKVLNKTTPDLSIVKRLGGSGAAKVRHFFELCKGFGRKVHIPKSFQKALSWSSGISVFLLVLC